MPERPFKNIFDEISREVIEAYGGAKRAVCGYRSVDVSCIAFKPCLTYSYHLTDGQRDDGWLATTARDRRYAIPLAVKGTRPGITKRQ